MNQQSYANHQRWVPMYHFVSATFIYSAALGSVVNLIKSVSSGSGVYSASLITVLAFSLAMVHYYMRLFALRAQDRAIRAEENLRHFVMTGKLLDPKLTMRQIIGLRFASDEEFLELEKRAVAENFSEGAIKKAIKNWRGDYYRA